MGPLALLRHSSPTHSIGMEDAHQSPSIAQSDLADTIVVGYDGSRDAGSAFTYALTLAERLGASLLVVRAWTIDTAPHGTLVSEGYVSSFPEADAKVARVLEKECSPMLEGHPDVSVRFHAKFGQPASVLIATSSGAMMLVLGCRGRGGFTSLLLGSVSEQCTHHARCPVLIVRSHETSGGNRS